RLGQFLDRPGFPWKKLIIGFQLTQYVFEGFLSLRQYKILQQTKPPQALADEVKQETFDKSQVTSSQIRPKIMADTRLTNFPGLWSSQSSIWIRLWTIQPGPEFRHHLL
ncbi:MAG: hypothetical protein Q9183_008027, partial [Haloplaca sp. 2 TL-2023]